MLRDVAAALAEIEFLRSGIDARIASFAERPRV